MKPQAAAFCWASVAPSPAVTAETLAPRTVETVAFSTCARSFGVEMMLSRIFCSRPEDAFVFTSATPAAVMRPA